MIKTITILLLSILLFSSCGGISSSSDEPENNPPPDNNLTPKPYPPIDNKVKEVNIGVIREGDI